MALTETARSRPHNRAGRGLNGRIYINAPGGRALYQADAFRRSGLELKFLVPYEGAFRYLLPALVNGDRAALRSDILHTTVLNR